MKIYIAGAITGDPEYREKFRRAEEAVRAEGHVAVNPAVLPEGLEPGDYMRICTAMLDSCDAIALMRDWAHSKGAMYRDDLRAVRREETYETVGHAGRAVAQGGDLRWNIR